jgi:hypothetical protein
MIEATERVLHLRGNPREIGILRGRLLGKKLEENIDHYMLHRPQHAEDLDQARLRSEALPTLCRLPIRFQDELKGLAEGAGIPLQRIAEWVTVEQCVHDCCSGFISVINKHAWVGRNNDFRVPGAWGFVTIREINNRIPTISFGMEGDVFTATGINQEQLWIHSQFLPNSDTPRTNRAHLPGYVILTEALETCVNIRDVETLLGSVDRDEGAMLFVLDGKTDESAILECSCREYSRRGLVGDKLIGTNHSLSAKLADMSDSSTLRFRRLAELLRRSNWEEVSAPANLIAILADDKVEQRDGKYVTVEAAVACPARKVIWYTLGGYPAASCGRWTKIEWPWIQE